LVKNATLLRCYDASRVFAVLFICANGC
jgi:hypothetical protein